MTLDELKSLKIDARGWVEIIIVCVMVAVIWVKSVTHEAPVNQWTKAPPAPEIRFVERRVIVPKKVIVYVDRAKDALDLPPEIKNNPDEHVLQAAKLAASDHPKEAVCTQNSETGESALTFRIMPMPWLAAENKGQVMLDYGIKNGAQAARLSGRWDVLAVKDWDIGLSGEIYNDLTRFVGIGVSVRLW